MSPYNISDWIDLDDIRADTSEDYVLINNINSSSNGYAALASDQANPSDELIDSWGRSTETQPSGIYKLTHYPLDNILEATRTHVGGEEDMMDIVSIYNATDGLILLEQDALGIIKMKYSVIDPVPLGWEPLGYYTSGGVQDPFTGTIDGNGHTISDLYIYRYFQNNIGLLGYVSGGKISDIEVSDAYVNGFCYTGTIAGYFLSGAIASGCRAEGVLIGNNTPMGSMGGIVGHANDSLIVDCISETEITASGYYSGGILGYSDGSDIERCTVDGDIVTTGRYAGGIVGYSQNPGNISYCSYSGTINISDSYAGGIAAYIQDSVVIDHCSSLGAVYGWNNIGGVVGYMRRGSIVSNSYSKILASGLYAYVGGLVGENLGGSISGCYAEGDTYGTMYVGGLIGYYRAGDEWGVGRGVYDSYAKGKVTRKSGSNTSIGGFIGRQYEAEAMRCYSIGSVYYLGTSDPTDKGFIGTQVTSGGHADIDNFWDSERSNQSSTIGNAKARTTTQMKNILCYTSIDYPSVGEGPSEAWDMVCIKLYNNETWKIWDGREYPFLGWEDVSCSAGMLPLFRPTLWR